MSATTKTHQVRTSTIIDAGKAEVWAVLADFDDVFKWAPGVTQSHAIGKSQLGVGHGRHCEIKGFGGLDEIITDWKVERGFEYSVTPVGPLHKATSRWSISEAGTGKTRLDIVLSYQIRFGIVGKLLHSLMVRSKLESSLPLTAAAVKNRVESAEVVPADNLAPSGA